MHDDVIKWKYFPRYWPFVRGIHRSSVNSPHKGQWRGALMSSLVCALNKRLSKQSWCWWFQTPSRSLWRHCNGPMEGWPDGDLIIRSASSADPHYTCSPSCYDLGFWPDRMTTAIWRDDSSCLIITWTYESITRSSEIVSMKLIGRSFWACSKQAWQGRDNACVVVTCN